MARSVFARHGAQSDLPQPNWYLYIKPSCLIVLACVSFHRQEIELNASGFTSHFTACLFRSFSAAAMLPEAVLIAWRGVQNG